MTFVQECGPFGRLVTSKQCCTVSSADIVTNYKMHAEYVNLGRFGNFTGRGEFIMNAAQSQVTSQVQIGRAQHCHARL